MLQYIIGAIILVLAVVLIILITLQQGKRKGLENVISGNSSNNSYLNKTEAAKKGKRFEKWTLYIAILFCVLVLVLYTVNTIAEKGKENATKDPPAETTTETTDASGEESKAETSSTASVADDGETS